MTKRMFTFSILAGIAAVVGFLASPACAAKPTRSTGSSSQNENWYVVQEGDEFKPIRSTDLTNENKRLKDQYNSDMKKWKAEKVKDPDAPRPKKLIAKVKKKNLSSQDEAKAYCDKLQEELDKKNEGKDTKDTKDTKDSKTDKAKSAGKGA